jgi:hypothetical protein
MNTDINHNGGSGTNWLVFLFGAMYNLLLSMNATDRTDFVINSLIGATIVFLYKLLSDWIGKGGLKNWIVRMRNKRKRDDNG